MEETPNIDDLLDCISAIMKVNKTIDGFSPNRVFINPKDYMYNIKRPKMKRRGKLAKQLYGRK